MGTRNGRTMLVTMGVVLALSCGGPPDRVHSLRDPVADVDADDEEPQDVVTPSHEGLAEEEQVRSLAAEAQELERRQGGVTGRVGRATATVLGTMLTLAASAAAMLMY